MQCKVMKREKGITASEFLREQTSRIFLPVLLNTKTVSRQVQTGFLGKTCKTCLRWQFRWADHAPCLPRVSCNLLLKMSAIETLACLKKEFMHPPIAV